MCIYMHIYIYIYTYTHTLRINPGKKLPGNKSYLDRQLSKTTHKNADIVNFRSTNPARQKLPISATCLPHVHCKSLQFHCKIIALSLQCHCSCVEKCAEK